MPTKRQPKPAAPKPKRGRGRPQGSGAFEPTPEMRHLVKVMAGMGIPEDQMVAAVLNPKTRAPITPVTLRKYFKDELREGHIQATAQVGASLFKNATTPTDTYPGGVPVAQIFWLKCRGRWQQNPERNPLPPPPPGDEELETADKDVARRLAFMLQKAASEA